MRRDVLLDLGPYARQVLLRDQAIAYKDVNQPFEDLKKQLLVIRTGECSGRFELQVSQRLMVESLGFDSHAIQASVDRINRVLISTKQKTARQETMLLGMLLVWLCVCFTGAFLTAFYMHFGYAFLFLFLFIGGCLLFYLRFKRTTID